ncbi:MAG TPA: ABC transporter ATP-binding protein [Planctomycetota bacterium]|nr:ABC transporter ATP-binding protein [Planctomycetota bacterium]
MPEATPLLELVDVSKQYEGPAAAPPVLDGVSLRVEAGESLAIVGPSGCGKSTLLNLIGALDRPTSGRVLLRGTDLASLDDKRLALVRNREIGFVFQLHHLLPQCTVLENVLVPTLVAGALSPGETPEQRARRLLERVGLADRADYFPGQLSGGERQRAAVVRALINAPNLLLADEPTGSLDRASAENLAALLVELNREEKVTLILVTHALDLAGRMSRVLELRDGELRASK